MCHRWCAVCQKNDYDADIFHGFVGVHIVVLDSFTHFRVIKSDYGNLPKTPTDALFAQSYIFQGVTWKSIAISQSTIFKDKPVF